MREVLRSIWDEPRPTPPPPARVWRDWALITVVAAATLAEAWINRVNPLFALAILPALFWRRAHPLLMVAVGFGVCGILPFLFGHSAEMSVGIFLVFLPYALFRWGAGREIVAGSVILAGRLAVGFAAGHLDVGDVIAGLIVLFGSGALGLAMRYRARARLRDREQAALLERERVRELEQVQLRERERLARDLHDTVAHHVSAMAIRAQAGLATAGSDPDSAVHALRLIESEASQALAEMRALVRILREDTPGLAEVRAMAGPSQAGPPVDVRVTGDLEDLPPQVATTLYRLTQESVTNARRHARRATRILVSVSADETAVRLRVSDDGEPGAPSEGYGLTGMIERAGLLGGTVSAGPGPERGWTVDAVLPRAAA
ncbi:histidine kinase [Actinoplanes sp. NPDC051861]|uniref:sensor histidine kinase n=1 Tax=Actinoplanes sp. NPDC051861 TaxID=3155170 RepID=UPI003413C742